IKPPGLNSPQLSGSPAWPGIAVFRAGALVIGSSHVVDGLVFAQGINANHEERIVCGVHEHPPISKLLDPEYTRCSIRRRHVAESAKLIERDALGSCRCSAGYLPAG